MRLNKGIGAIKQKKKKLVRKRRKEEKINMKLKEDKKSGGDQSHRCNSPAHQSQDNRVKRIQTIEIIRIMAMKKTSKFV